MVSSDFTNDFHLIIHTLFLKGFRKVCEALFAIFKYLICKWKCWELLQDIDLCLNNNSKAPTSFNNWIINVQLHIPLNFTVPGHIGLFMSKTITKAC